MSEEQKFLFEEDEKPKIISYDFCLDSVVAVDAPIGTDPDTLWEAVFNKLAQRVAERDLTFRFENIFDGETGAYDDDWENYSKENE